MSRRPTFSEQRWPLDQKSVLQARRWANSVAVRVLDWTWRAFDELATKHLSQVNLQQPLEQLERDLTSLHFTEINRLWASETQGYSSMSPHHEYPENARRPRPPGRPPANDIAFVWYANPRVAWPLEAKVVQTPKTLAEYLEDVQRFLNGTAAPFVGEGGQVAYLLRGTSEEFFVELAGRLNQQLQAVAEFQDRPHRASQHDRHTAPPLQLHHMAMLCIASHAS